MNTICKEHIHKANEVIELKFAELGYISQLATNSQSLYLNLIEDDETIYCSEIESSIRVTYDSCDGKKLYNVLLLSLGYYSKDNYISLIEMLPEWCDTTSP